MNNVIAIIPARAGSKGLPGKNIRNLNEKPLIAYTIEAAIESGVFKKIVVSTDGIEIAKVAQESGAEVPFLRPDYLSGDEATSIEVVEHCLDYYRSKDEKFNIICLLQPTSPLRNADHIKKAWKLFLDENASRVSSVCECEHPPLWAGTIDDNKRMHMLDKEIFKYQKRQLLPTYYRLNGAIYFEDVELLLRSRDFIGDDCIAYVMDKLDSVDIDSIEDFLYAEYLIKNEKLRR